jgi:hypothetical protein
MIPPFLGCASLPQPAADDKELGLVRWAYATSNYEQLMKWDKAIVDHVEGLNLSELAEQRKIS